MSPFLFALNLCRLDSPSGSRISGFSGVAPRQLLTLRVLKLKDGDGFVWVPGAKLQLKNSSERFFFRGPGGGNPTPPPDRVPPPWDRICVTQIEQCTKDPITSTSAGSPAFHFLLWHAHSLMPEETAAQGRIHRSRASESSLCP